MKGDNSMVTKKGPSKNYFQGTKRTRWNFRKDSGRWFPRSWFYHVNDETSLTPKKWVKNFDLVETSGSVYIYTSVY